MKTPKYHNKPCTVGAENYRSKKEAARHQELLLLQRAGEITGLMREAPFVLARAVKIQGRMRPTLRYMADFVYSTKDGNVVVEDAKGVRTEGYRIKRHLMASVHGIEIQET